MRLSSLFAFLAFIPAGLDEKPILAATTGLGRMQRECLKYMQSVPGGPEYTVIVNCSGRIYEWRPDGVAISKHAQNRILAYVSFSSLLFSAPEEQVSDSSEAVQCPSFSEWQGTVKNAESIVRCRELLTMERLDVFCTESIKDKNFADPTSVIWERTGRAFSPCQSEYPQ